MCYPRALTSFRKEFSSLISWKNGDAPFFSLRVDSGCLNMGQFQGHSSRSAGTQWSDRLLGSPASLTIMICVARSYDRRTALHIAAAEGNLPAVRSLASSGLAISVTI